MKHINSFLFERKHFVRNPFKIIALILFVLAGIYGLHSGAKLFNKQQSEITKINQQIADVRENTIKLYNNNEVGPKDRPWVNIREPYWAIGFSSIYKFKEPSPSIVYSIGQAEQYGFYKKVTVRSSPYDSDMAEEIANPERLNSGTLDFSFAILFLLPLLLLILTYNIKSYENEQGFLSLIMVQNASKKSWLISRILFYLIMTFVAVILLLVYGASLTNVFSNQSDIFIKLTLLITIYILFWGVIYYFILQNGKNILGNTLKMIGVYLLFTFILPSTVNQWISIEKPTNLMTDFIDATRDKKQEIYDESNSLKQEKLINVFPEIKKSKIIQSSSLNPRVISRSIYALTNNLMKESIKPIQKENEHKNNLIENTYWFNPVTYFQNQFNKYGKTHYVDYQEYRNEIQEAIDLQIKLLVMDNYNDIKVDKTHFLNYLKQLNGN